MVTRKKIDVAIITGFLGAGKTNFINNLLKKYTHIHFALVENEFGEVSIDIRLIKGINPGELFELKNGCICCSISNEFELVLDELSSRFPDVQHLLIETTGIADPALVLKPFFSNTGIRELYSLPVVWCVVDALNFEANLLNNLALKQLVAADIAVVTKSELPGAIDSDEIFRQIRRLNRFCRIAFVQSEEIDEIDLFHAIAKPKLGELVRVNFRTDIFKTQISSKFVKFNKPLNKTAFTRWLDYLLDVNKTKIYRVKGIVYFANEPFEMIVQGVGSGWEITEGDFAFGNTVSQLIFIGELNTVDVRYPY